MKIFTATLILLMAVLQYPAVARQQPAPGDAPGSASASHEDVASLRITSPLGRTGLVMTVRIVAQVHVPNGDTLSAVNFYVDGMLVGTVESGPPYAVDWTDDNPFEPRQIIVQATDQTGRTLRDEVTLPRYEVNNKTEVMGVLLETAVYDKAGHMVSGVDPKRFTVYENGVEQKIDLVTPEAIPTNLLLLVDNSQSMSRRMDLVRVASVRLARTLREKDRVIVAPFNVHVGTVTGPTADLPTIGEAIGAMHAKGGTALLDALVEATNLLKTLDGRRLVVLITDGYDENSTTKVDDAIRAIEGSETTIYTVGIGGTAGISLRGEDLLKRISYETGGKAFFPPREVNLGPAADMVAADAHNRYLVTYTPTDQKKDGTWREVSIEVPEGLHARTRAGYFAPSPPPIRPALEFTVMDAAKSYVDVTADDFEVTEDGIPQTVDTFQEAVDPVAIVMALDSSGSMKKAADLVRSTAHDFVSAVRPEDSLALITFADEPKFQHALATNRQWSHDAIDKYTAIGGTALYDALWNSFQTLKDVKARRAVVVLTDGRDENNPGTAPGSAHVIDEVLKLEREVGATVYAVGLGTKVDRDVLLKVASQSGGQAFFADNESTLGEQFRLVVESLRRRYVLSYTSTNGDRDGKWRSVQILPRTQGQNVSTRGGYFAPAQ